MDRSKEAVTDEHAQRIAEEIVNVEDSLPQQQLTGFDPQRDQETRKHRAGKPMKPF